MEEDVQVEVGQGSSPIAAHPPPDLCDRQEGEVRHAHSLYFVLEQLERFPRVVEGRYLSGQIVVVSAD